MTLLINDAGFQVEFRAKIAKAKNPVAMLRNVGREVGNQLNAHFQMKNDTNPNKLGGRRTNFWLAVSKTINNGNLNNPQVSGNTVTVTINDPKFPQKVFGGRIVAKAAKALTIPLTPEAYGKTAGDFPGAFLIKTMKGAYIVKVGENITVSGMVSKAKRGEFKGRRAGLNFLFKLVPFVDQDADPTALPPQSQLAQAALARAQAGLDAEMKNPS